VGGSGGGGSYRLNPSDLAQLRQEAQERLERTRLDADVNGLLQRLLVEINDRDSERVSERLDEIVQALRNEVAEIDRLLFGGSVAKHTWVDGLSDVDSLVILDAAEVGERTPEEMRRQFEDILRRRLDMGEVAAIDVGRMAVTVKYQDGMEIQLLPAVERGDALTVSSPSGADWARIDPKRFSERLSQLNRDQAGAAVPAIKVAKAILAAQLPEEGRPTGYHVEALAIAAFEGYDGPRTPKAMAQRFFERAAEDVLRPISDVTGQSRYVDADLGGVDSPERRRLARNIGRVGRTMESASSAADWQALLE
jgi:Second Messenger Oligonucleotide or Dinucleotide Synthetase domain